MSRITGCFQTLSEQGKKALIPYFVGGDRSLTQTLDLMHQSVQSGADILELGVPFSDPMAEGPVIQLAHERALVHQTSLWDILETVGRFRETNQTTPVVLMGYANPVEAMGYSTFANLAAEKGVDGVLIVDLPPEEAGDLQAALKAVELDLIFLVAPTTSEARMADISRMASGYLYYVSLKGVTGAGGFDIESVRTKVDVLKRLTDLPVSVGFGIKDADSARRVGQLAEGVVVGSAIVQLIEKHSEEKAAKRALADFMQTLRNALDQ